jgi:hypothetical protein
VEQAQKAIVGYTIFNDWSASDLQMLDSQLGIGQSKGKDSGITLGPYLVTPDELEPYFADGRPHVAVDVAPLNEWLTANRIAILTAVHAMAPPWFRSLHSRCGDHG